MELWERYERELTPLPDAGAGGIRVLEAAGWERREADGWTEYERKLALSEAEVKGELLLRMNRVGCIAEVYEDGERIGGHYGSFTEWEVRLLPGEKRIRKLTVRLRDDRGNISPFERAGIFGEISLVSLPEVFLADFNADTELQNTWSVRLRAKAGFAQRKKSAERVRICAVLQDCGHKQTYARAEQEVTQEEPEALFTMEAPGVRAWSTEEPTLYALTIRICQGEETVQELVRRVGFRTVRTEGKRVLWNEKPLKLRGLCYREPLGAPEELLRKDLELFRAAGVNYLRSLYYPFGGRVLELCDELGILTEQSASAYQVGRGCRASQNLPDCRARYAEQFSELLKSSRSHVSVLLWCVGTESVWGGNFRLCAQMARALAPSQLWNFSYPMTIPQEDIQPDVWSVLYADWRQPLDVMYDHMEIGHANGSDNEIGYVTGCSRREEKPVLHEVYAHLPCYNREELLRDYGVHDFWGESIARFQEKMERTPGALGGSVMAAYDEDGSFSKFLEACGWGILDTGHEPKPEYHHLKMAFTGGARAPKAGPLENSGAGPRKERTDATIEEHEEFFLCRAAELAIQVSKRTGLVSGVWRDGEKLIESGPYLHVAKLSPGAWTPKRPGVKAVPGGVEIAMGGSFEILGDVSFRVTLRADGELYTEYAVTDLKCPMPPQVKAQIGLDPGGLDEFGISYLLPAGMDTLSWTRRGLWEEYPDGHPGRQSGTAKADCRTDFESMKRDILSAEVSGEKHAIRIEPGERCSIRMKEEAAEDCVADDRDASIRWRGSWLLMDDAGGNYQGTETLSRTAGDSMEYTFQGTGVRLLGPADHIGGLYRVTLDGTEIADRGSSFVKPVDIAAASRGYEKRYGVCMADVQGLLEGSHTLCLEVLGEKAPGGNDTWVSVDCIEVNRGAQSGRIRMILNSGYNYTRLVRGNYMEAPVRIELGKRYGIRMRLTDKEETENE